MYLLFSLSIQGQGSCVALATTPEEAVESLVSSECLEVFNIEYGGYIGSLGSSIGTFENNHPMLDMDAGLILMTSDVTLVNDDVQGISSESFGFFGNDVEDEDLADLAGTTEDNTHNAAVLEFDFVPAGDVLEFNYVFASEEYPNYVCSNFNDVFGFFISGPDPSGGNYNNSNIAVLPDAQTVVSINTVNNGSIGSSSNNNAAGCNANNLSNTQYHIENNFTGGFEFYGATIKLTTNAPVVPCETYHLKLAVCDIGDRAYDSAVFVEANSFNTGGGAVISGGVDTNLGEENTIEGCINGFFMLEREDIQNMDDPVTLDISFSGSATYGLDFITIPEITGNQVTIPIGFPFLSFIIITLVDNIAEGNENILIETAGGGCPCNPTSLFTEIIISDPPPLDVNITEDIDICQGMDVNAIGDYAGYFTIYDVEDDFIWLPNDTIGSSVPSVQFTPSESGVLVYAVRDICGQLYADTMQINVLPLPDANWSSETDLCENEDPLSLVANDNSIIGTWNGDGITDNADGTATFDPENNIGNSTITYVVDHPICPDELSQDITVHAIPQIEIDAPLEICIGEMIPIIFIPGFSGTYSFDYTVNGETNSVLNANGTESIEFPASEEEFTVSVTSITTDFCSGEDLPNHLITVHDYPVVGPPIIDCQSPPEFFTVSFSIEGGESSSYSVLPSNGGTMSGNSPVVFTSSLISDSSSYQFFVQDQFACDIIEISGFNDCLCVTDAGNMNLNPLQLCEDEVAIANHLGDEVNDGNDVFQYVLHTSGLATLGNIIEINDAGSFTFQSGMSFNETYYISLFGGNNLNGIVDFDDPCLSVAPGIPVVFNEYPSADAGNDIVLNCFNETTSVTGQDAQNITNATVAWLNESGDVISNDWMLAIENQGTFEFVVYNANNDQCFSSGELVVTEDFDEPELSGTDGVVLDCNTMNVSTTVDIANTSSNMEITWTFDNETLIGETSENILIEEEGTYQILVENLDNGCTNDLSIAVTENFVTPDVNAGVDATFTCETDIIDLSGSTNVANYNVAWNGPNGFQDDILVSAATEEGTYELTITDITNGCSTTDQVNLTLDVEVITIALPEDGILTCTSLSYTMPILEDSSYENWEFEFYYNGLLLTSSSEFVPEQELTEEGTYIVVAENTMNGCSVMDTLLVTANIQTPTIELGSNIIIEDEFEISEIVAEINSGDPYSILWSSEPNGIIQQEEQNMNSVTVTGEGTIYANITDQSNGCENNDVVEIVYDPPVLELIIPNAFSPNSDNYNDFFGPIEQENIAVQEYHFEIFNRWGERSYLTNVYNEKWNGQIELLDAEVGVYIYFINVRFVSGQIEEYKGNFTLIK